MGRGRRVWRCFGVAAWLLTHGASLVWAEPASRHADATVEARSPHASVAEARHASTRKDLQLRQLPVLRIGMRPTPVRTAMVANAVTASAAPASAAPASLATGARPSAATKNGVRAAAKPAVEQVSVRVNASADLQGTSTSGAPLRGGTPLDGQFDTGRSWLVGDALLSGRGVMVPSLNAYLLSSFQFDARGAEVTALPAAVDARGQNVLIRAGYVEWGRDNKATGVRQRLWVRGGRQFRQNAGALLAYFDGVTVGWQDQRWQAAGFVGRRVALYGQAPAGVLLGGSAALALQSWGFPSWRVVADALALAGHGEAALRHVVAVRAQYEPRGALTAVLRARLVGTEAGFGVGRVGARVRWTPSKLWLLIFDAEQRSGVDVAYDLAAPAAVDVVQTARSLGVGLTQPVRALTGGLRVDYARRRQEWILFARTELPWLTAATHDRVGFVEGGGALGLRLGAVWANAQLLTRQRLLTTAPATGGAFADSASAGIASLHEFALDGVWRSGVGSAMKWRVSAGAFYRSYRGRTPYATFSNDGRGGARVDVQYWATQAIHVLAGGEVAQPSPTFARELDLITSLRAGVEAVF